MKYIQNKLTSSIKFSIFLNKHYSILCISVVISPKVKNNLKNNIVGPRKQTKNCVIYFVKS